MMIIREGINFILTEEFLLRSLNGVMVVIVVVVILTFILFIYAFLAVIFMPKAAHTRDEIKRVLQWAEM
jgi:hypothetical protein